MEQFDAHRAAHASRAPDMSNKRHEDEAKLMSADDGLFNWVAPPVGIPCAHMAASEVDGLWDEGKKYLWIIRTNDVVTAQENSEFAKTLGRTRLSHTNLTGGADAHTGGELWFISDNKILINGGSSRYKPRTMEELISAADGFRKTGYTVGNMGFDNGIPARRGRESDVTWSNHE